MKLWNHDSRRWPAVCLLLAIGCSLGADCCAGAGIEMETSLWGFSGNILPNRFNLLSILVANNNDQPVELILRLQRNQASGREIGAELVEPVFLGPFQRRWVQFQPFVSNQWENWTVAWSRSPLDRYPVPQPQAGDVHRVLLVEEGRIRTRKSPWKSFPETLFPGSVTGTDTLQAVLLDHNPKWETARRRAFLDWLYAGGKLFIQADEAGNYPQFTSELSRLNVALDSMQAGLGSVTRLPVIEEYDRLKQTLEAAMPTPPEEDSDFDGSMELIHGRLTSRLRSLTTVHHNWRLIHGLVISYLLLVFPGWYLLARRRIDFRTTMASFLGLVAIFSLVFHQVGRRGYGESTQMQTLTWAQALPNGHYWLRQWSNAFVTGGDYYSMTYPGEGHLFSTAQQNEKVNAVIDNGNDGSFQVDIPLFSSRGFVHESRVPGRNISLELTDSEWDTKNSRATGRFVCEGLKDVTVHLALGVLGDSIYTLERDAPGYFTLGQPTRLISYLGPVIKPDQKNRESQFSEKDAANLRDYQQMVPYIIARALELRSEADVRDHTGHKDRLRVFLMTDLPADWKLNGARFPLQTGYVIYDFPIVFQGT